MGFETSPAGARLVVNCIDEIAARDPHRQWGARPRNNKKLSEGFQPISYSYIANAINHASWWLKEQMGDGRMPFEVFAYQGPNDLRALILAVAAAKTHKQILLPSPMATAKAQEHVLQRTNCTTYIHASTFEPSVDCTALGVRELVAPEIDEWLSYNPADTFPYTKSWDEAKFDPWVVVHTSGTTGLPKPITYTNMMMSMVDAVTFLPSTNGRNHYEDYIGKPIYSSFPMYHCPGIFFALQTPVFLNSVYIMGPPTPATSDTVQDILKYANPSLAYLTPSIIEGLSRTSTGLDQLKHLKHLHYAGAPLRKALGDQLKQHVPLTPIFGSTECGGYHRIPRCDKTPEDYEYVPFAPENGVVFEPFEPAPELCEFVFHRDARFARWQQIFWVYPDEKVVRTKDLFQKHPTKEGLWRFVGRVDDFVSLAHGPGMYVAKLEAELMLDPRIETALVGGQGRTQAFVVLSPEPTWRQEQSGKSDDEILEELWPLVEMVNRHCSEIAKLRRETTMIADADRSLPRTGKGGVARNAALGLYEDDVERLYQRLD
ncbi:MAG: hypothetical protein Q9162_005218 [Coniocarpon cinnabarinum]